MLWLGINRLQQLFGNSGGESPVEFIERRLVILRTA